ncbi:hypothetical protein [Lysinibacillus fusiformis]|uniref:Uncharacterized protein n=1 Tax=Lysinibacillus fusiformis TaxID=28031 RepID=A0A1E4QYD8_9BACI|nr:hypothetical protein [Lysinibacillus fusiformis]ODV53222.1 hypothetical protein BG258_23250 [Lysinibacillus fusiformis]
MSVKNRSFNVGRQSEQLMNEELFRLFESIRPLLLDALDGKDGPESETQGSLWLDQAKNELKTFNKERNQWDTIFNDKFRITGELLDEITPANPVKGQLWINQGMLWYFTGQTWQSVKAFDPSESEVYYSSFEDFLLLSPMQEQSNKVVDKDDEGNDISLVAKSQYLTPSLKTGRFYIDHIHKVDYEAMNQVALQYPSSITEESTPSWVHVNPGRLTEIRKRFIRIHKDLSSIDIQTERTEFYGYKRNSPFGHLLRPVVNNNETRGDYYVRPEGIMLTFNAIEKFDYILAITYEFSWIKTYGVLRKSNSREDEKDFYVGDFSGPVNVFLEGYDLENDLFYHNAESKTINIDREQLENDIEVSIMKTFKNEYGVIQKRSFSGEGIIRMRKDFTNPLVIVNGMAHHKAHGGISIDNEVVLVKNARKGMTYSIIELEYDDEKLLHEAGIVNQEDENGHAFIHIQDFPYAIPDTHGIILFVDGLLVKKEEIIRDYANNRITVNGLAVGQEFVLLHDKDHMLLFEESTGRAIGTGKFDESLLFMNGYLLCNDTAIVSLEPEEDFYDIAVYGEIKQFVSTVDGVTTRIYKEWNNFTKEWVECSQMIASQLDGICFSYENAITAVIINIPHTDEDEFDCYAYNFAHTIENPLVIKSKQWTEEEGTFIPVEEFFVPGTNTLQVYLNGVRLHSNREHPTIPGYKESDLGDGFYLPVPYEGLITYVLERPEKGATRACDRILLTKEHVMNIPNVYKCPIPLYPGWVTIYVNGIRMPHESYFILDNYTIKFKDNLTKLIGHESNFPTRTEIKGNDPSETVELPFIKEDLILIEVRQKYDKQEKTYTNYKPDNQEINVMEHNIPPNILEANDEILIYINGLFTGYKHNVDYRKDRAKGVITLLNDSYSRLINYDPLYKFLETDPKKMAKWELKYGRPYIPKIKNVVTLEWR